MGSYVSQECYDTISFAPGSPITYASTVNSPLAIRIQYDAGPCSVYNQTEDSPQIIDILGVRNLNPPNGVVADTYCDSYTIPGSPTSGIKTVAVDCQRSYLPGDYVAYIQAVYFDDKVFQGVKFPSNYPRLESTSFSLPLPPRPEATGGTSGRRRSVARQYQAQALSGTKITTFMGEGGMQNCQGSEQACYVTGYTGEGVWSCIDTQSALSTCGGCPGTYAAQDCATIDGASTVACVEGQCQVTECEEDYTASTNRTACIWQGLE